MLTDPSAGSPTDTLLRLLLPLNAVVQRASSKAPIQVAPDQALKSKPFTETFIGRSDGRCVQRAGT
jgi:hypothetical protein